MLRNVLALSILGLVLGCGGGEDEMLQVTGTVKNADGSPVTAESAMVVFQPVGEGRAASGSIGPDGDFEMMTFKPGDGMKPGQYKVVLEVWKDYRARTPAVPTEYTTAEATPLEATVDDDNTHFDFVVEK